MDQRSFRNAMGKFTTGVTVITTTCDDEVHGMTANAFMSISLDPMLISISIAENAQMYDKIKDAGKFAVSILSDTQEDMSMYFAGQIKERREIDFEWLNELPLIPDALAHITCRVYDAHKAGDHTIFIGEVKDVHLKEDLNPLVFYQGRYHQLNQS